MRRKPLFSSNMTRASETPIRPIPISRQLVLVNWKPGLVVWPWAVAVTV